MILSQLERQYGNELDQMTRAELADLDQQATDFFRRCVRKFGATGLYREPLLRALHRRHVPQQRQLLESRNEW